MEFYENAVAYARVSTLLNQDPENQLVPIRELAKVRGFGLSKEYIDRCSGSLSRRPELDQLIWDAKRGKFKTLIIYAIDRLGRDVRHLLNLMADLEHYGVNIVTIREGFDFSTPIGKATLVILSAIAEFEKDLIKERIKCALASKKQLAEKNKTSWRCGRPPLSEGIKKKVLALHQDGLSIRRIEKELGGKVSRSSVERIINGKT